MLQYSGQIEERNPVKKLTFLIAISMIIGIVWWNRYELIYSVYGFLNRPEKPRMTPIRTQRLEIEYVPSPYLSEAKIKEVQDSLIRDLESAEKELDVTLASTLRVFLFNNWEEIGSFTGHVPLAQVDPKSNKLYYVVNEKLDGTRERLEFVLLLRQKYGKPGFPAWGPYMAASLSGVWNQRNLNEWAEFLVSRGLTPTFPQFFNDSGHYSPYLLYPWNAIFARFVKETFGWNAALGLYRTGQPPLGYENQWAEYQKNLPPASKAPAYHFRPEFQKGVSYAYANSYDAGYATRQSQKSLDLLRQNRVEWIASIPYGYMREPDSTRIGYAGDSIFSESDEGLFALTEDSKARGMKVMLKPQIWLSHSSWPGNIKFTDNISWERWFLSYENWILHYAIIAELTGADLLCIGTELVETTVQKPDLWKKLIARVRGVYHGPIVYAANWGKEFEQVTFWQELDYIGLDNYYPVRGYTKEHPDSIKENFQLQKEKIEKIAHQYQKPVLFTEIGFVATEGAGMGARESDYSSYNEEIQAVCYRLTLETYWGEPWFCGMYWWKWFSDPEDRGRRADTHSPSGRPAEQVMKEWYQKERLCYERRTMQ